jgi:hypothetical protein
VRLQARGGIREQTSPSAGGLRSRALVSLPEHWLIGCRRVLTMIDGMGKDTGSGGERNNAGGMLVFFSRECKITRSFLHLRPCLNSFNRRFIGEQR